MRIGILHDSLNFAGGAEKVCLATISAAREMGHRVILGTIDKTDWRRLNSLFGVASKPEQEIYLMPANSAFLRSYLSMLLPITLSKLEEHCDLCIYTNQDVLPLSSDIGYMHYLPLCHIPYSQGEKGYSSRWRIYTYPSQIVQRRLLTNFSCRKVLVNSSFTRRMIKEKMDLDTEVVYPPVDVGRFSHFEDGQTRANRVVSLGRLSPEKNFEFVLALSEQMPDATFVIISSYAGSISRHYLKRLLRIVAARKLKNVSIFVNIPQSDVLHVLHRSEVFLHAAREEHFGIAIVEAMAAGLIPLVPRSGGQWEDILAKTDGLYGFSYESLNEAKERVQLILKDRLVQNLVRRNNRMRVKDFSAERFKQKIREIIGQVS